MSKAHLVVARVTLAFPLHFVPPSPRLSRQPLGLSFAHLGSYHAQAPRMLRKTCPSPTCGDIYQLPQYRLREWIAFPGTGAVGLVLSIDTTGAKQPVCLGHRLFERDLRVRFTRLIFGTLAAKYPVGEALNTRKTHSHQLPGPTCYVTTLARRMLVDQSPASAASPRCRVLAFQGSGALIDRRVRSTRPHVQDRPESPARGDGIVPCLNLFEPDRCRCTQNNLHPF